MVFVFTTGICLPGDCRNIQFEHHTVDKILVNNTIRTVTVNNNDICEIFCYKEPNCVSYNCGPEDSELKQCDLNNRSHWQASNTDFITKEGYIYRSVLVSRKSNLWKTIVTVSLYIQVSSCFAGNPLLLQLLTDIILTEPLWKQFMSDKRTVSSWLHYEKIPMCLSFGLWRRALRDR